MRKENPQMTPVPSHGATPVPSHGATGQAGQAQISADKKEMRQLIR
jgi:hypothetical protein